MARGLTVGDLHKTIEAIQAQDLLELFAEEVRYELDESFDIDDCNDPRRKKIDEALEECLAFFDGELLSLLKD